MFFVDGGKGKNSIKLMRGKKRHLIRCDEDPSQNITSTATSFPLFRSEHRTNSNFMSSKWMLPQWIFRVQSLCVPLANITYVRPLVSSHYRSRKVGREAKRARRREKSSRSSAKDLHKNVLSPLLLSVLLLMVSDKWQQTKRNFIVFTSTFTSRLYQICAIF